MIATAANLPNPNVGPTRQGLRIPVPHPSENAVAPADEPVHVMSPQDDVNRFAKLASLAEDQQHNFTLDVTIMKTNPVHSATHRGFPVFFQNLAAKNKRRANLARL